MVTNRIEDSFENFEGLGKIDVQIPGHVVDRGRCAAGLCSLGARRRSSTGFVLTDPEMETCMKRAVDKKNATWWLEKEYRCMRAQPFGNTHTHSPEHGHQTIYLCVCVLDQRGKEKWVP